MNSPQTMITSQNVDLSNCDREQIQYSGAILPHGALLTVSEPDLRVLQASVNCDEMLGIPADQLIGDSLWKIFDKDQMRMARDRLGRDKLDGAPSHLLRLSLPGHDFDVFAHRRDGVLILEFENSSFEEPRPTLELYSDLRSTIAKLQATRTLQEFLDLAADQIREFTGFDRVMMYKFMEDGSGWVRSESLADGEGFTRYLGLHYPASDIPEPAQEAVQSDMAAPSTRYRLYSRPHRSCNQPRHRWSARHELCAAAQCFGDVHRISQEHGHAVEHGHDAAEGRRIVGA